MDDSGGALSETGLALSAQAVDPISIKDFVFETILKLLGAGLQLWADKERHKYIDRMLELKKDWYAEYNKPLAERDNAVLDHCERELLVLCETFTTTVGVKGP